MGGQKKKNLFCNKTSNIELFSLFVAAFFYCWDFQRLLNTGAFLHVQTQYNHSGMKFHRLGVLTDVSATLCMEFRFFRRVQRPRKRILWSQTWNFSWFNFSNVLSFLFVSSCFKSSQSAVMKHISSRIHTQVALFDLSKVFFIIQYNTGHQVCWKRCVNALYL